MARPIKPTPILSERQADQFKNKVELQLSEPLKSQEAPCLARAKEAIFAHAVSAKK
jgi:hypothetical protein